MSEYGSAFDRIVHKWAVIENMHDEQHPERDLCGGIGRCSMMFAAVDLERALIDELDVWRKRQSR